MLGEVLHSAKLEEKDIPSELSIYLIIGRNDDSDEEWQTRAYYQISHFVRDRNCITDQR